MSLQLHILFMLYKAKENNKGLSPLGIRVTYQKQRRQITTGYFLTKKEWAHLQSSAKVKEEKLKPIAEFMQSAKSKLLRIANTLEMENRLDLEMLLKVYQNKPKQLISLLALFRKHNAELEERTSLDRAKATYNKYRYTYDKLQHFIQVQYG